MSFSKNNNQKIDEQNAKPNFIETLAGQKISGPKISVVKRWVKYEYNSYKQNQYHFIDHD